MGDAMRSSDSGRELAALSPAVGSGRPAEAGCAGLCRRGAAQTRQIAQPSARDRGIDRLAPTSAGKHGQASKQAPDGAPSEETYAQAARALSRQAQTARAQGARAPAP